jgi:two-component sensor histidine kinase
LRWTESHTKVKESKRQGFGTRLIERGIQQNLGGKAEVTFAADGLRAKIEVPLERGAQNAARPARSAKAPKALEAQTL